MDISTGKILDFSVVDVGTVENFSRMELKGRISCLTNLENAGKKFIFSPNRHPQVKAYMRNQRKDINLQFDVSI